MPLLLEMPLKRTASPIGVVAADFAFVLHAKSVELVEPIRNGLAVPADRIVVDCSLPLDGDLCRNKCTIKQ